MDGHARINGQRFSGWAGRNMPEGQANGNNNGANNEIMERNKARTDFFVDIKDFSSIISRSETGI
jgi:hypothetical protein